MTSPDLGNSNSDLPFPFQPIRSLVHLEESREAAEQALENLAPADRDVATHIYGNLAGISLMLGDGPQALEYVAKALNAATAIQDQDGRGHLLNTRAAIECHMGLYVEARASFGEAEALFTRAGDALGMAWTQHLEAREYARDQNDYARALQLLNGAMPVLRARSTPDAVIQTLLTQIDCLVRTGESRRARDAVQQAEFAIHESKSFYYRPELMLMRAQLSLFESNFKQAWQYCYSGLGMVSDQGDLRMLTPLYTALALALEYDRNRADDARDALERAITAGRSRARRLHLSLALRQMGMHLRRYFNRPTVRARGSGYLFEADQQFSQMGLAAIYNLKKSNNTGLAEMM